MEGKEYLKQLKTLRIEIDSCKKEIEYLKDLSTSIPACKIDEFVDKSPTTSAAFEKIVVKIDELQRKSLDKINQLLDLKETIRLTIESLDDREESSILQLRYEQQLSWSEISSILKLDERTTYRRHKSALQNFEKNLKVVI